MGFFDDLKKGFKDISEAAKNSVEEAKAREAQRAEAGTLVSAPPQAQPTGNALQGKTTRARLMKEGDGYKLAFGTPNPVPFEDPRYPFPIGIKFNGFIVIKDENGFDPNSLDIDKTVMNAVDAGQVAIGKLSMQSCTYDHLPAGMHEIRKEIINRLQSIGVNCSAVQVASITADSQSRDKIKEWESKPDFEKAAELTAAGKAAPAQPAPVEGPTVTCTGCGTVCRAGQKFCSNCGAVLPQ